MQSGAARVVASDIDPVAQKEFQSRMETKFRDYARRMAH
jgi:hypothetical protein